MIWFVWFWNITALLVHVCYLTHSLIHSPFRVHLSPVMLTWPPVGGGRVIDKLPLRWDVLRLDNLPFPLPFKHKHFSPRLSTSEPHSVLNTPNHLNPLEHTFWQISTIFTGFSDKNTPFFMVSTTQRGMLKNHTFYLFLGPALWGSFWRPPAGSDHSFISQKHMSEFT